MAMSRTFAPTAPTPCRTRGPRGWQRQANGAARGDSIVRWLLAQALAGSREQAVTLAEAMRRQGLLVPAGKVSTFVDSSSASYQLYSQSRSMARHTSPA
eukprot:scaffold7370_cov57-Phaeocystis_antarctica.AAC.2